MEFINPAFNSEKLSEMEVARKKKEIYRKFYRDMLLFGRVCFPSAFKKETPPFHQALTVDLCDDSEKRLLIAAPRGTSKSTLVSFLYVMWRVAFKGPDEDLYIIILSEAKDQSVRFLNRIKYHLTESKVFRNTFGDLTEATSETWREDKIVLGNGTNISCLGTGGKIRGAIEKDTRPSLIIADDFESEKNSLTKEAREKNRRWITDAVIPSLADDGKIVIIGTVIHGT